MNSLAAFMMNTVGAGSSRTVTDDTKVYATLSTYDNNLYYLSSTLHINPTDRTKGRHFYTSGDYHTDDPAKKVVFRPSADLFLTMGTEVTFYDPSDSTFFVQDPAIGYDDQGTLHAMMDCHESFSAGDAHEIRYMTSTDDGATVSAPVVIPFPATSLLTFRFYGRIIDCGNGILMCFPYFFTEEGVFTNSERWCLRTDDYGANWDWILIASSTDYTNETEGLYIGDGVVIAVSRHEPLKQFWLYKSLDYGLTWIDCGALSTGIIMSIAAPCRLHKFNLDDGTSIVAMYFHDKGNTPKKVYAMYGRANVAPDAGVGLFKQTTITEIASDAAFFLNYGDVCHYNNNLNARGVYSRELNFPDDNALVYFECPATQYGSLFTILTPVTIYDKLAAIEAIYSWQGLLSNNINDWGSVNVSSQVLTWKSIFPGPPAKNFSATVGGILLGDGIVFDGTKALSNDTVSHWNFMQYSSAGVTDINFTYTTVFKPGIIADPNAAYGLFGTNGASAANKGIAIWWDDRVASSRNNALRFFISAGGGVTIVNLTTDNLITPQQKICLRIRCDLSQSANNDKVKVYINKVLQSTTVSTFNTGIVTVPTYNAQIGAVGNNVLPFIGSIYEKVFQNAIDLDSVSDDLDQQLMDLNGI
jgi:hypothetical protein